MKLDIFQVQTKWTARTWSKFIISMPDLDSFFFSIKTWFSLSCRYKIPALHFQNLINCEIIQSSIGKVPMMQEHRFPSYRTIQKQRYLTCNFMYSFSFFFISCSCWVFTCFNTIQWSDWQESEAYPFWSRVIQTRRHNKQNRSNSNLIANNHSLKLIPLLLQLLNLSLQSCRVFSFLYHRNSTPIKIKQ